jgi:cardiolipin synthase
MKMNKGSHGHYLKKNLVKLIRSGEEFISNLEALINTAEKEIHLQTYIFEPDETGRRVMDALKQASIKRGIKIFVLVDAYGSQNFGAKYLREMTDAGIEFRYFGKLFSRGSFHIGRRLHRKVLVADGRMAIVGGMNISNKYSGQGETPEWLDFAVRVDGDSARRLLLICRKKWMRTRFKRYPKNLREGILNAEGDSKAVVAVKVGQNDYIYRKNEIAKVYRQSIKTCEQTLTLVGGYFLPGGQTRRILKDAVQRGVDIKLIVSYKSDVKLVYMARRYLYSWLLKNKIRIYEYHPSNVHGKVLIADGKFTSIGSYDLNNLSTYSNIELNLNISDENFAKDFENILEEIIANQCSLVTEADFRKRVNSIDFFLSWISYQLVKTLFMLSLLLAKKSE